MYIMNCLSCMLYNTSRPFTRAPKYKSCKCLKKRRESSFKWHTKNAHIYIFGKKNDVEKNSNDNGNTYTAHISFCLSIYTM